MELDLMLIIALTIAVVLLVVLALKTFRPLTVTLTVGPGRQITVGGTPYPASGPAKGPERFVVPRTAVTRADDDIVISIGMTAEQADQPVSLSRRRLRTLHIDAGLDSNVVVYGCYEPRGMRLMSYAAEEEEKHGVPKCIWCRGEIIVCGIDPKCR